MGSKYVAGLLLVTFILILLFIICDNTNAATIIVDDDNGTWSDYETIQGALNAAADGDVVRVMNGIYNETIEIENELSIVGNGSYESIIGTSPDQVIIKNWANNVSISRLGITQYQDAPYSAVVCYAERGIEIVDCHIFDCYRAIYIDQGGCVIEDCMILNNSQGVTLNGQNNVIDNCSFDNEESLELRGKYAYNRINNCRINGTLFIESSYNLISNCLFYTNCSYWDPNGGIEIEAGPYLFNNIINCTFDGVHTGIELSDRSENTNVTDCQFIDCARGIYMLESDFNRIRGSSFIHCYKGIWVYTDGWVSHCRIIGNSFENCTSYAVSTSIEGCFDNRVFKNNFISNANSSSQVSSSDFIDWYSSNEIGNYWSDYSGLDLNEDGIGDSPMDIRGSDYHKDQFPLMVPWNGTSPYLHLTPREWIVDDNNGTWANFGSIKEATTRSRRNDCIRVLNGTYLEQVLLKSSVTLQGNGSDSTKICWNGSSKLFQIEGQNVTIKNLEITASPYFSTSIGIGLGLLEIKTSHTTIIGCSINGFSSRGVSLNLNLTLMNCSISDNDIGLDYGGGGLSISNCTFSNNSGSNGQGIQINLGKHPRIEHCRFLNNYQGIMITNGLSNMVIDECEFIDNEYAVYFDFQHGHVSLKRRGTITNCTFSNNSWGIWINEHENIWILGNIFSNCGIRLNGEEMEFWNTHVIDSTNTVNGLPITYIVNETDRYYTLEAGQFLLSNCTNVHLNGSDTTSFGFSVGFSNNCGIRGYNIHNAFAFPFRQYKSNGTEISWCYLNRSRKTTLPTMSFVNSNNNSIHNCSIFSGIDGVTTLYSNYNRLIDNIVSAKRTGFRLQISDRNVISRCYIFNCSSHAINIIGTGSLVYLNSFINNGDGTGSQCISAQNVSWDNGTFGNYWSDYEGSDSDSDGIGDTSYVIDPGDYEDSYPLIEPWNDTPRYIGNRRPKAMLIDISPNPADKNEPVTFIGNGTDQDGYVVRFIWISSIDGEFYNGSDNSTTYAGLSPGNHSIMFSVKDNNGSWSKGVFDNVIVKPAPVNKIPVALITSIDPLISYSGEPIEFDGNGSDPDGNVTHYSWSSIIDGEFHNGTEASTSYDNLSIGTHMILFSVMDDNNTWSHAVTRNITVRENFLPTAPNITSLSSRFQPNSSYEFHFNSYDPENGMVRYVIDWGDGANTTTGYYASGSQISLHHWWTVIGNYTIRARSIDNKNQSSNWSNFTVMVSTFENLPPFTPQIVSIPSYMTTNVTYDFYFNCTEPDGDAIRYIVDWGEGVGEIYNSQIPNTTVIIQHEWTANGTYDIRVAAVDVHNAHTNWSDTLTIEVLWEIIPHPPASPTEVIVENRTNEIVISWKEPLQTGRSPILGYRIYRNLTSGNFEMIAEVGVNTTMFIDTNVSSDYSLKYYVVAFNSEGESPESAVITAIYHDTEVPDSDESSESVSTVVIGAVIVIGLIAVISLWWFVFRR